MTRHDQVDAFAPIDAIVLTRPHTVTVRFCDGGVAPLVQRVVRHSPTGFSWGYTGSGPHDLALNILRLFIDASEAEQLYHAFVHAFIAHADGEIAAPAIRAWIAEQESPR